MYIHTSKKATKGLELLDDAEDAADTKLQVVVSDIPINVMINSMISSSSSSSSSSISLSISRL